MTKYIKRPSGGYYAQTVVGMVTVERRYEFTSPTRDWVARFGGETVIGTSREDAVERMLTSVHAKEGRSARRDAALELAEQEDASLAAQRAATAELYGPTIAEPAIEQDLPRTANPRTVNQVEAVVRGLQLRLDKLADTSGIAAFTFEVTGYDRDAVAITLLKDGRQVASVAAPENTTADALYQLGYRIHREALGRVVQAWVADQEPEPVTAWDVRVVSPMDQDRQIRRLVAELGPQGRQLGLNKDHLWAMATDLYNAGVRFTDPGSPIQ